MKPWLEFGSFLGLALGAHLLVWQGSSLGATGTDTQAGQGAVAMTGARTALQDLVAAWDAPPAVAPTAPDLHTPAADTAPLAPQQTQTPLPTAAPALPIPQAEQTIASDTPPPPPPKSETKPKTKPKEKPKAKSAPPKPAAARAKGQSGKQAGQSSKGTASGSANTGAADPGQMARWGGAIRSSIERRKRYPGGTRAKGAVSLAITVSSSGALAGLTLARSSGDAALDRAALAAVKAARLPKAPAGIPTGTHRFTLSVAFAP